MLNGSAFHNSLPFDVGFFFYEMNYFCLAGGCIKLIKNDSKDFYNVTNI